MALGSGASPSVYGFVENAGLAASSNIVTVMMNLGASLYLTGKNPKDTGSTGSTQRVEYSLTVNDSAYLINTPRVGIIQIGKGLFTASLIKSSPTDSMANAFIRLAVFFHEARHSDGNGDNAGFPHALCTSGDYKDHYACEMNTNGPYAVQATLARLMRDACTDCTADEKEGMRLLMVDYQSRLQPGAQYSDQRPEALPL